MSWREKANSVFGRFVVGPVNYYHDNYGDHGYNEPIYQSLFLRQLNGYNINDNFIPIGGAASYSLLYHIFISLEYLKKAEVLELGAGQSTLLISACYGKLFDGRIITIEQDENWAESISRRVRHAVEHVPVCSKKVGFFRTVVYNNIKPYLKGRKFNLIIVDGPTGSPKMSRYSILDCVDSLSDSGFIIIFDDTHRVGEKQTLTLLLKRLRKKFGLISMYTVRSSKHQTLIMYNIRLDKLYLQ